MASPLLSWLLRLATLWHLTMLPAGQHHGMSKCSNTCSGNWTPKIPLKNLASFQRNEASCRKSAIILTTIKNRTLCANPEEKWVQEAVEHLKKAATASIQSSGTFEKQIGATNTPAASGMDRSAVSEPKATGQSSSQETQKALGTSPEVPIGVASSWGTRSAITSKAPDGEPSAGPDRTEVFNVTVVTTTVTTTTSWQSSASQPGSDLWVEGRVSEATSASSPSPQTPSSQAPSTQAPPTQAVPTQAASTQAPSAQAPPTQAPSTQAFPPQTPSTQAPTILHTAPEDSIGSEGQPVWTDGQDPMPENSLGSKAMGPVSAHTDAFMGPGSMPHVSVPDTQAATRRQAVGLLAFLGLLFCLGVAMFAYQSLQGCPRNVAGDMVEGFRYVPRSCGSNSYVLVPV
ncbi:fractalkine [Saccopteryx bilineata]|uniref:fractalkine n=1 Tax=Saccopteryx bilineata TaxID=59482 RepID=UPI00338EBF64